jgi:putative nucleotidyltransferase with HDIG domain
MPRSLALFIAGLVAVSVFALIAASLLYGFDARIGIPSGQSQAFGIGLGLVFWTLVTIVTSALPVKAPGGVMIAVALAPCLAAMFLGGPAAGGWVALIGSTELRELRGEIPWYGSLSNHAGIVLPAVTSGVVLKALVPDPGNAVADLIGSAIAATVYSVMNLFIIYAIAAMRAQVPIRMAVRGGDGGVATSFIALAPLAWLMAQTYERVGWWTTALYALPLYMIRLANERLVEMREMFTQTIKALAGAVDKRDPSTALHSRNVSDISVEIGGVLRLNSRDMEALEWGGLLHDVGKIGVPDYVLLKEDRLTRDERQMMNSHPVLGAEIIAEVTRLAPELPIIRHHHEWYNGSGYPDRLLGEEIPRLARVLHVADAFEAMTASRPYRKTPLSKEQALGELRKFAGIQFDPEIVDAFVKTGRVDGVPDPGRVVEIRPVPMLAAAASLKVQADSTGEAAPEVSPRASDAG